MPISSAARKLKVMPLPPYPKAAKMFLQPGTVPMSGSPSRVLLKAPDQPKATWLDARGQSSFNCSLSALSFAGVAVSRASGSISVWSSSPPKIIRPSNVVRP